jgi:hypothetical protein
MYWAYAGRKLPPVDATTALGFGWLESPGAFVGASRRTGCTGADLTTGEVGLILDSRMLDMIFGA